MVRIESFSKWKTHLVFCGLFLAAVAFTILVNMIAGERFSAAASQAIREIRPLEVVMFFAFWYVCACYQPKDDWSGSFTRLNLGRKKTDGRHRDHS